VPVARRHITKAVRAAFPPAPSPDVVFSMRARDASREAEFQALLRDVLAGGRKAHNARVKLRDFPLRLTVQCGDVVDSFNCLGWDL